MKIEVKKHGAFAKAVLVDGVLWGSYRTDNHGPRGVSYVLEDSARKQVRVPAPEGRGRRNFTEVKIYSDTIYNDQRRRDVTNPSPFIPLAQRLVNAAMVAIENGHLRSPETLVTEAKVRREAAAARDAEVADEQKRRFDARIDKILAGITFVEASDRETLRERIYDAMDWAQSQ